MHMANPLFDTLFARHAGSKAPFLHLADGSTLSYDAFLRRTARLAHALHDAGLAPGDRLAAQVPKSAGALAVYAACLQAGIVFLPLNSAYTPDEVSYFVTDSGAGLLLCDPAQEDSLRPLAQGAGAALMTLDAEG